MFIRLYVRGHLKEILTADEGSDKVFGLDEVGVETVPVPPISAGDDAICSDLTSRVDVC